MAGKGVYALAGVKPGDAKALSYAVTARADQAGMMARSGAAASFVAKHSQAGSGSAGESAPKLTSAHRSDAEIVAAEAAFHKERERGANPHHMSETDRNRAEHEAAKVGPLKAKATERQTEKHKDALYTAMRQAGEADFLASARAAHEKREPYTHEQLTALTKFSRRDPEAQALPEHHRDYMEGKSAGAREALRFNLHITKLTPAEEKTRQAQAVISDRLRRKEHEASPAGKLQKARRDAQDAEHAEKASPTRVAENMREIALNGHKDYASNFKVVTSDRYGGPSYIQGPHGFNSRAQLGPSFNTAKEAHAHLDAAKASTKAALAEQRAAAKPPKKTRASAAASAS